MFHVLFDTTEKQINQFLTYCYERNQTTYSTKELMAVFNYKTRKAIVCYSTGRIISGAIF